MPRRFSTCLFVSLGFSSLLCAQTLPQPDAVRVTEFYRLAAAVQDQVWPHWSEAPAPLLLVTEKSEFLTHHPTPPKDFTKVSDDFYARPRQFPPSLQATFPAFGPPSVIVIGQPQNTGRTSTRWLITVMHEHFHQLQNSQSGYYQGVEDLGLSRGDNTGMWMLNYPFPYDKVAPQFAQLRDLLLNTLSQSDPQKFTNAAAAYSKARERFFLQLSPDDHKYLAFQIWQEGVARYSEVKAAEAAARYQPSDEYVALPDYESFASYAAHARSDTLDELRKIDMSTKKREVIYPWGAAEGFLLDRLSPEWREKYLAHPFSLDQFFEKN
jgi:hypothetical protein